MTAHGEIFTHICNEQVMACTTLDHSQLEEETTAGEEEKN
jgi:hypothetical protein